MEGTNRKVWKILFYWKSILSFNLFLFTCIQLFHHWYLNVSTDVSIKIQVLVVFKENFFLYFMLNKNIFFIFLNSKNINPIII